MDIEKVYAISDIPPVDRRGRGVLACRRYKNLLFLSGHCSQTLGKASTQLDTQTIYEAAREVAFSMLATLKDEIGNMDRIEYFVKALGIINSGGEYSDMPAAVNGFSDTLTAYFSSRGQHARAAMGAPGLPGNAAVLADMIVKLRE